MLQQERKERRSGEQNKADESEVQKIFISCLTRALVSERFQGEDHNEMEHLSRKSKNEQQEQLVLQSSTTQENVRNAHSVHYYSGFHSVYALALLA